MSSSTNLRQLIQNVRGAKTQTEERSIIQRECATIRHLIGTGSPSVRERSRAVLKLSYISMLGYSTEFAQMQVVTLIAENDFVAKRVAYLALAILLDERQEVLTLAENHLKRDLTSGNALVQCLALDAVANLAGEDMVHDTIGDITSLLDNTSPSVRRKACIVALRIVKKVPGAAEAVFDKLVNCTAERNHGVLISALNALAECVVVMEQQAAQTLALTGGNNADATNTVTNVLTKVKDRIPTLVNLLKSLILSAYATEYDVGAVADPFLQCSILRFFSTIVSLASSSVVAPDNNNNSNNTFEAVSDILAQVATNTDGGRNVGCAVLYECVRTIGNMNNNLADDGLRVLAVNILGRFVLNKDNNIRYVALSTLKSWIAREAAAVQRHRMTIMECLRDTDLSIRRKALELTVALVNTENVRSMVPDLIAYLGVCSPELKPDCCSMLCDVVEAFSPNSEWRVETSLRLFTVGESTVPIQFGLSFIGLLTRLSNASDSGSKDILQRAVTAMWNDVLVPTASITNTAAAVNHSTDNEASTAVTAHLLQREAAILVAIWTVGEFASTVLLPALAKQGGEGSRVTLEQIYYALASLFEESESSTLLQYILSAVIKMVTKASNNKSLATSVKPLFDRAATSLDCELQQRACEYLFLLNHPELASAAFGTKMPAIPEKKNISANSNISLVGVGNNSNTTTNNNGNQQQQKKPASNFDDIFGGGNNNNNTGATNNNNNTQATKKKDDFDIFGPGPATGAAANNNNNRAEPTLRHAGDDIFGGGGASSSTGSSSSTAAAAANTTKKFEAFSNSDLSITFNIRQKIPTSFSCIEVEAYVKTQNGTSSIQDLVFFVSVLKTMQVQLAPALTTNVNGGSNSSNGGLGTLVQKFSIDPTSSNTSAPADVGAVLQARVRASYAVMGNAKNETFTVNKDLRTI